MPHSKEKKPSLSPVSNRVSRRFILPPSGTREWRNALISNAETQQKIRWDLDVAKPEVHVDINTKEPIQIFHLSDTHIGHLATDHRLIEQYMDHILDTPNCYVILYGDLTEGEKPGGEYLTTNANQLIYTPDDQLKILQQFMSELVDKDKLIALVGGYHGHDMWMEDGAGADPYGLIAKLSEKGDRIVHTGGKIFLHFPDGSTQTILAYHDAGGGGSDFNPLGAQRRRVEENSADIVGGGHYHTRKAVGSEVDIDGKTVGLMATGTFKGIIPGMRDKLLTFVGAKPTPPGVASTHYRTREGAQDYYLTPDKRKAEVLFAAEKIWDQAVRLKVVEELEEKIHGRLDRRAQPKLDRFSHEGSRIRKTEQSLTHNTKHWEKLVYHFEESVLPVQLYQIANYRAGSTTSDRETLERISDEIVKNPHGYTFFLRQMVDAGTPKRPEREEIVKTMLADIGEIYGPNQKKHPVKGLAWLYDSVLRDENWKKIVEKNGESFYAATEIEEDRGIPLIDHSGELVLEMPGARYSIFLLDGLNRSASVDNPQQGLRRVELRRTKRSPRHDVVVGGDMPVAAVAEIYDHKLGGHQGFISPGYMAEWSGFGKKNRQKASPAGQSAIFFPNEKLLYLADTFTRSKELYEALMLYAGLGSKELGGLEYWSKVLDLRNKRTFTSRKK